MKRIPTNFLTLAAATLVSIAGYEGYVRFATPPVPGDYNTGGYGSIRREDGTPMRAGEEVKPERALVLLLNEASKAEQAVKKCAPVPMYAHEFSAYVSLTYNIGEGAFCRSTIAKRLNAGDYVGACEAILMWDKFKGKPLRGLTNRRQSEYRKCMGL